MEERYPLNPHAQQLVRLGDGQRLPDDEDVNTLVCSEGELEQSDEDDDVNTPVCSEAEPEQSDEDDDDDDEGAEDEDWTSADRAFDNKGEDDD